ncbi:prepilin-type N-terminal cleavage/methylation domain-containing protein [Candidatus Omnitrophota bacterium]
MKKGVTLIELIIVVVLFVILVGFIMQGFLVGLKNWGSGINRAQIRQDANLGMNWMVRELGQASSITTAAADEIEVAVDLDDDGTDETVNFAVSSNQLMRTVDSTATILSANVATFTLAYRDLDDNPMSLPADTSSQGKRDDIRVVIITLAMNNVDESLTLSSSVYVRNQ